MKPDERRKALGTAVAYLTNTPNIPAPLREGIAALVQEVLALRDQVDALNAKLGK